ncbi:MAG: RDD family protein [Bacteroidaceae bacterium]|nr:RDD family protein [Bacteroidaceae bacterium]
MPVSNITTDQFVQIQQTPAGLPSRIGAALIDYTIVIIYFYLFYWINYYSVKNSYHTLSEYFIFIYFMIGAFYQFFFETFNKGRTIGKIVFKIRVVNKDGSTPTIGSLFMRHILRIVDYGVSGIGIFIILFSKNNQRIGDFAAATMVIHEGSYKQLRITLDEFAYASKDYTPVYPEARNLSLGQAELIRRLLSTYKTNQPKTTTKNAETIKQMDILTGKICNMLNIEKSSKDSSFDFLTTILHDYQHIAMELI